MGQALITLSMLGATGKCKTTRCCMMPDHEAMRHQAEGLKLFLLMLAGGWLDASDALRCE